MKKRASRWMLDALCDLTGQDQSSDAGADKSAAADSRQISRDRPVAVLGARQPGAAETDVLGTDAGTKNLAQGTS